MIPADIRLFKKQVLQWAAGFDTCCYLDSNNNNVYGEPEYDLLVATGGEQLLVTVAGTAFEQLKAFHDKQPGWLFGFFSYDLKNEVEQLHSRHPDYIEFPAMLFFRPEVRLEIKHGEVFVYPPEMASQVFGDIERVDIKDGANGRSNIKELQPRFTKEDYLNTVTKIREHIAEGDIYEMNLCQEFYADGVEIDPVAVFQSLNVKAKAPFSAFIKYNGRYLLSSSPERFLQKTGDQLRSQPIKGTARRGKTQTEDYQLKEQLHNDIKERAENVMIVDLVRNDLSRVCQPGTVQVDELFGIYTFEQVHQMVSTVSGQLRPGIHFTEAIKSAFPMGSMTGAPKIMAMELIEQYERTRRGLYSGAVGYITPAGDFDLNVVIRSIFYNQPEQYLSYQVGGAITYDSVPENEYGECLLKAQAMREVLGG